MLKMASTQSDLFEATVKYNGGLGFDTPMDLTGTRLSYRGVPVATVVGWGKWPNHIWVRAQLDASREFWDEIKRLIETGRLQLAHELPTATKSFQLTLVAEPGAESSRPFGYRYCGSPGGAVQALAESAGAEAAVKLGLCGWALKWFEPCALAEADFREREQLYGYVSPGERVIHIATDVPIDAVKMVVAHECRHGWHQGWSPVVARPSDEEDDALEYGKSAAKGR